MSTQKHREVNRKNKPESGKNVLTQVPVKFLLEHLNNAFTIFDYRHQKFMYANPQFLYFVGLPDGESNSLEEEFLNRINPQDAALFINDVQTRIDEICRKYINSKNKHLTYSITLRLKDKGQAYEHVMIQSTMLEWHGKNERSIGLNLYISVNEQKKDNAVVLTANVYDEKDKRWATVLSERFCSHPSMISKKECEVMKLIVVGNTARKISEILGMSYYTVRAHWRNILSKTNCKSQSELKALAIKEGWI